MRFFSSLSSKSTAESPTDKADPEKEETTTQAEDLLNQDQDSAEAATCGDEKEEGSRQGENGGPRIGLDQPTPSCSSVCEPTPDGRRMNLDEVKASTVWGSVDASEFNVRSQNYAKTKVKEPSLESMYECYENLTFKPTRGKFRRTEVVEMLKRQGKYKESPDEASIYETAPEYIVINAQVPNEGPSVVFKASSKDYGYSLVSFFKLKEGATDKYKTAFQVLKKLLRQGKSLRNEIAFKFIGTVDKWETTGLPETLRRYNSKPALITDVSSFLHRDGNVLCIDYDVRLWSYLAKQSVHAVSRYDPEKTRTSKLKVAYLLEGKTDEELPEQVLGCFSMTEVEIDKFPEVDCGIASDSEELEGPFPVLKPDPTYLAEKSKSKGMMGRFWYGA